MSLACVRRSARVSLSDCSLSGAIESVCLDAAPCVLEVHRCTFRDNREAIISLGGGPTVNVRECTFAVCPRTHQPALHALLGARSMLPCVHSVH